MRTKGAYVTRSSGEANVAVAQVGDKDSARVQRSLMQVALIEQPGWPGDEWNGYCAN